MLKDNHGYTIIEVLVAFVILTIVGTMVMGALRSVSRVMVEGSYIKNTTNTVYEEILSSEVPIDVGRYESMEIHMNNGTTTIPGIYGFMDSETTSTGYEVALTKMEALPEVKWIPNNYTEVDVESMSAQFKLLNDSGKIPMEPDYILDMDGTDDGLLDHYSLVEEVENAVRIDTPSEVYGAKKVSQYLINLPSANAIRNEVSGMASYSVVWIAIRIEEDPVTMEDVPVVYGYVVPNVGKYFIFENALYELEEGCFDELINTTFHYRVEREGVNEFVTGRELFTSPNEVFNKSNGVWYLYKD